MNLAILPKKAALLVVMVLAIFLIYALAWQSGLNAWSARDAEGLAVLVQLIGDVYAVLLAFMIFVIWTQFTEVENCVLREADSLQELLRYGGLLDDDARSAIRKAITNYARRVLTYEWQELGDGRKDSQTAEAFSRLVNTVAAAASGSDTLRDHLLETLRTVSRNRDDRLARSLTRMPPTLSGLVKLLAAVLFILVFVYPFRQPLIGAACLSVAALVLYAANFVMTDTDNPLKGVWNVRPDAFNELPH